MKKLLPILLLLSACSSSGGGVDLPEKPNPRGEHQVTFRVLSHQGTISGARIEFNAGAVTTSPFGFAEARAKDGTYTISITAAGFKGKTDSIVVSGRTHKNLRLDPDQPLLGRLRAAHRTLLLPSGDKFDWRGLTAFRLLEFVASGNEGQVRDFLKWGRGHGFNISRVLAMLDGGLFTLNPEAGLKALPRLAQIAQEEGFYLEITLFAGTRGINCDKNWLRDYVRRVGPILANASNTVAELANENSHPTQCSELNDVEFLKELRGLLPGDIPTALGSTHAGEDESDIFKDGDFINVHLDRGRDKWNMVRRVRELLALSERTGKFVVNDEPQRFGPTGETDCAIAFAFGALGHGFNVGTTYHFDSGRYGLPETGGCAADLAAGLDSVNTDLRYTNAGFIDSPVEGADFSCIVRAYSFLGNPPEVTIPLGIICDPKIQWKNNYKPVGTVDQRQGVQVLRVEKR